MEIMNFCMLFFSYIDIILIDIYQTDMMYIYDI